MLYIGSVLVVIADNLDPPCCSGADRLRRALDRHSLILHTLISTHTRPM